MPTTDNGLWYPTLSGANNPPADFQTLGESIDAAYGKSVADWSALLALSGNFKGRRVWVDSLTGAAGPAVYNGSAWLAPERYVAKSLDETVSSSTTLQDDDHLALSIPAAGIYTGNVVLFGVSSINDGGDIKVGFTHPGGTIDMGGTGPDSGLLSGSVQTLQSVAFLAQTSPTASLAYGLSTLTNILVVWFRYVASSTGTLKVQWAQRSASGTSTLKAGSYMSMRQVA